MPQHPDTFLELWHQNPRCLNHKERGVVRIKWVARTIPNNRNKKRAACVSSNSISFSITPVVISRSESLTNSSVNDAEPRGTPIFQNIPYFQQQFGGSNNATIVHVPLLIHWT